MDYAYDLTAYNEKHNWANGEGNNDGIDDNVSWNCGAEGETQDQWINDLRTRRVKILRRFICSRWEYQ